MGIAMKRILGVEPKNRVRVNVMIEKEFLDEMKQLNMHRSDTMNVLLEKELSEKKRR